MSRFCNGLKEMYMFLISSPNQLVSIVRKLFRKKENIEIMRLAHLRSVSSPVLPSQRARESLLLMIVGSVKKTKAENCSPKLFLPFLKQGAVMSSPGHSQ